MLKLLIILAIFLLLPYTFARLSLRPKRNNVCKNLRNYHVRFFSPHCWYDPDVNATANNLASNHGYNLDTYEVITEDGYILSVFRIPPKTESCKGVVYLQHPAQASAAVWLDLGEESLAFLLSNEGYDVWMGNFRGTRYSMKHVSLSPSNERYWNFSFHEMGIYDLPAQLRTVMENTQCKGKITYVGHSVGTTSAFIYSSLLPANASAYVEVFICWSPIAFLKHVKSLLRVLAPIADAILPWGKLTGQLSGATTDSPSHRFVELFCFNVDIWFCYKMLTLFGGPTPHFSPARFPVLIYQSFVGFSLKSLTHFIQIVRDGGRFQWFNYGKRTNKKYYGYSRPPLYPVENINVSMVFIYGGNDYCSVESDVYYLYNKLSQKRQCGVHEIKPYNHFDFHYAKDVRTLAYQKTIDIINTVSSGNYSNLCYN